MSGKIDIAKPADQETHMMILRLFAVADILAKASKPNENGKSEVQDFYTMPSSAQKPSSSQVDV